MMGRDLDSREKHSPLLMKYLDRSFSQGLVSKQQAIDHMLRSYLDEAIRTNMVSYDTEHFLKLRYLRESLHLLVKKRPTVNGIPGEVVEALRKLGSPSQPADLDLFRTILEEARASVASWGGRMYFVYLPSWERYQAPDLDREAVLRIVETLEVPLIDLHLAFAIHPDPLSLFPSRRYAHYNVSGHQLVAEEILRHLPPSDRRPITSTESKRAVPVF